jgi:hypothetical protein
MILITPPTSNATELTISLQAASPDPLQGYDLYSEEGWDGESAAAITAETVAATRNFLRRLPPGIPLPDIAPAVDGTIGLEWRDVRSVKKLFVDIGPGVIARAYWRLQDGTRWEVQPESPGILLHKLRIGVFESMDCGVL